MMSMNKCLLYTRLPALVYNQVSGHVNSRVALQSIRESLNYPRLSPSFLHGPTAVGKLNARMLGQLRDCQGRPRVAPVCQFI